MTYRVIQWATGHVGVHALRGIARHPELELVGLCVHSEKKAGRDAGDLCGIVVGFELASIPLASGSLLLVKPVAFVGLGRFDSNGEFSGVIGYDAKMLLPIEYHFQAFALESRSQDDAPELVTSGRETLDFRDTGVIVPKH